MTHESSDLSIHHHPHNLLNTAAEPAEGSVNACLPTQKTPGIFGMQHPFHDREPLSFPEPSVLDKAWADTYAINETAGNVANAGWPAADHQIKIIESEFNELKKGIASRDIHELRDGIGDLLFTVIGLAKRCALPSIVDLAEVVRANKSKFDTSLEDQVKTAQKYTALNVETYFKSVVQPDGSSLYVTFTSHTQVDTQGREYIAGKWLKSYKWQDVQFEALPSTNALHLTD